MPLPKATRHHTLVEQQHLNVLVSLLPILLPSPDLVLQIQIVVPFFMMTKGLSASQDQSPDGIQLVGVVVTDLVPQVIEGHPNQLNSDAVKHCLGDI